ncbi:SCO family protein [Formosimonas limnophila]|nr:SCO family protein [Formosimonas limnophila]
MMKHTFLTAGLVALLAACQPSAQFLNKDITGSGLKTETPLTAADGENFQLNQASPQVTAVFFGFTQCPDVCPTTMGQMKLVMDELGADADKLRVVFVSVDPERDTREILKQYTSTFNPKFIGASTDLANTQKLARDYQITFEKVGTGPNYMVNHTANSYLIDRAGKTRVSIPYNTDAKTIAHDIKQLLK